MKIAEFFLYDESLGTCEVRPLRGHWRPYPVSVVYVCPVCAQAWGRVRVGSFGWFPRCRLCPEHGPGFLSPPDPNLQFPQLPKRVLAHDIVAIARLDRPSLYHPTLLVGNHPKYPQGATANA